MTGLSTIRSRRAVLSPFSSPMETLIGNVGSFHSGAKSACIGSKVGCSA